MCIVCVLGIVLQLHLPDGRYIQTNSTLRDVSVYALGLVSDVVHPSHPIRLVGQMSFIDLPTNLKRHQRTLGQELH